MDKRGASVTQVVAFVFIAFFVVLFLGGFLYGLSLVDNAFGGLDVVIGTQNFTQAYDNTLKQGIDAVFAVADLASLLLIFGMTILMLIVGYYWGDENKKFWILADFCILIVSFVVSVYLQNYFNTFITDPNFLDPTIYTQTLAKSSALVLRLPYYVAIVGVLIMIATYALSKRKQEGAFQELGY